MNRYLAGGIAAVTLLLAGTAPASAQTTLKVSSFLPPNNAWQKELEAWGEKLKEKSKGELTLEIFPAAQLGPPNRQYQLVTNGVADIAVILHSATPGRFPMTELAGQPLTFPSTGKTSEIMSRRLTELAPKYLAAEHPDTKILWMAVTPPLKLHTTKTDVTTVGDVNGLRVRYAGKVFQEILEAFGAAPLPIPPGETVDALSKGVADGAMFPYEATKSFNLGSVVKYSLEPGLASATFALVMNQSVFDGLSPDDQKIIEETTGPARAEAFGRRWDASEADGRQYMVDNNVKIETLSDEQIAPFKQAVEPIVKKAVDAVDAAGKPGGAFIAAYTK
ncbi:TRAP-type C4-dicarboxylate transport system substrate-binding protein [Rhizobium binae]|uniref:TRAP-type C4-dicarboxylate transport system substrate-binding protein n=1 Tax=Rhizobium binae TaxID=1138190 RepID=A0ABV2MMJ0_9HYPH|nr:TRAP transporter substrate-binding protein [Rhizobium binae]MBX4926432.1 TRAP transporter substrate-binding protein [Rhizobium binae]MBX4994568.1 TRAP transporter substrate-binding protein [Rhizobium binae]QSY84799.1 TRAP transporter substrate-binding protein [Rhizobium binae]